MDKLKGYKIEIYPTDSQKEYINRQIELCRWVYNWALDIENEAYENDNTFLNYFKLAEKFDLVYSNTDWLNSGIPKRTAEIVLRHVDYAYRSFFNGKNRHPKYKSKKYSKKSFEVRNDLNAFYFKGTKVKIPGLPYGEMVECRHHNIPIGDNIRYYRCVISFDGYRYWLSVNTERDVSDLKQHDITGYENKIIGIDLGIRKFAVLSNGTEYKLPTRKLNVLIKRNNRQHRRLSKMVNARTKQNTKPTKNEEKLRYKEYLTRCKIYNIKHSFVHEVTTEIANMYPKKIVMEDLKINTLKKMKHFSKINTGILYDARIYMEYKCKDRGIEFELADCCFPSSQICNVCGARLSKSSAETIHCSHCGSIFDRDLNAAINLSRYGL